MHRKFNDLTGRKFGRLTVQWPIGIRGTTFWWLAMCSCGNLTITSRSRLVAKEVRSCGCLVRDTTAKRALKHGYAKDIKNLAPEYRAWMGMNGRCRNRKEKNYYGRGIKVCVRWQRSFINFLRDVGKRPSSEYSLDRKNNDGHYKPSNVRWATRSEQARNRRPR